MEMAMPLMSLVGGGSFAGGEKSRLWLAAAFAWSSVALWSHAPNSPRHLSTTTPKLDW